MMTTNLFVIANVKQWRTGGSFRILLPFFRTSWGVGFLNSAIFNSFHNRVESGTILEGIRNFGGGGVEHPPRYATGVKGLFGLVFHSDPHKTHFVKFYSPKLKLCCDCANTFTAPRTKVFEVT